VLVLKSKVELSIKISILLLLSLALSNINYLIEDKKDNKSNTLILEDNTAL
jgi:hypothetical protein